MAVLIAFICVQAVLIALTLPIRLECNAHCSLARMSVCVQIKFAGISVARIKICVKNGLKMQLNGKPIQVKSGKLRFSAIKKAGKYVLDNKILNAKSFVAYVGSLDAKEGAILAALLQMPSIFAQKAVMGCDEDRLDAECAVNIKINAVQAMTLVAISKER